MWNQNHGFKGLCLGGEWVRLRVEVKRHRGWVDLV
jgi:hypothetical protein